MTELLSAGAVQSVGQPGGLTDLDISGDLTPDEGVWARITAWQLARAGVAEESLWIQFQTPCLPPYNAPVLGTAIFNFALSVDFTGTGLLSLLYSSRLSAGSLLSTRFAFAQAGGATEPLPASITLEEIFHAGGAISSTALTLPSSLFTTFPVTGNTATLTANGLDSNTLTL